MQPAVHLLGQPVCYHKNHKRFEDEFDIEIPDQKIKELVTVGDIVEYLGKTV